MNSTELVAIAKGWLESSEKFPINFDDIWEKAGYDHKWKAKSAFSRCVVNFGLQEGIDFATVRLESTGGRPGQTFKMTIGAAKRFLASAQTNEGYQIIEALIQAEEELQKLKRNLSPAEFLLQQAQMLVEMERRDAATNNRISRVESEVRTLKGDTYGSGFVTIMGYCADLGIPVSSKVAAKYGRTASALAKHYGAPVHSATSEIWGHVNTYSRDFLKANHDVIFAAAQFTLIS
jgi:phage anti-repressor protein